MSRSASAGAPAEAQQAIALFMAIKSSCKGVALLHVAFGSIESISRIAPRHARCSLQALIATVTCLFDSFAGSHCCKYMIVLMQPCQCRRRRRARSTSPNS